VIKLSAVMDEPAERASRRFDTIVDRRENQRECSTRRSPLSSSVSDRDLDVMRPDQSACRDSPRRCVDGFSAAFRTYVRHGSWMQGDTDD